MKTNRTRTCILIAASGAAALVASAFGTSAVAGQCSQIRQSYYSAARDILGECEQIRRQLDYSVCHRSNGGDGSNSCYLRVAAPHRACLRRVAQTRIRGNRVASACNGRRAAVREAEDDHNTYKAHDRIFRSASRANSAYRVNRLSISRKLTKRALTGFRKVSRFALRSFVTGVKAFGTGMAQSYGSYGSTYGSTYRSYGSTYGSSYGTSYRRRSSGRYYGGTRTCGGQACAAQ